MGLIIILASPLSIAKMAITPEQSDFTRIQRRIKTAIRGKQPERLLPFVSNERKEMPKGLLF